MAFDSAAKRRSAVNYACPFPMVFAAADSSIDADDRATLGNEYEGITFQAGVTSGTRRVRRIASLIRGKYRRMRR